MKQWTLPDSSSVDESDDEDVLEGAIAEAESESRHWETVAQEIETVFQVKRKQRKN